MQLRSSLSGNSEEGPAVDAPVDPFLEEGLGGAFGDLDIDDNAWSGDYEAADHNDGANAVLGTPSTDPPQV